MHGWRTTYAGRYAPGLVAIAENHGIVWADARLAIAGAHGDSQTLGDHGAEVGELLCLFDGERGGRVGAGFFKLGAEFI